MVDMIGEMGLLPDLEMKKNLKCQEDLKIMAKQIILLGLKIAMVKLHFLELPFSLIKMGTTDILVN